VLLCVFQDLVGKSLHQLVVASDAPRLAAHLQDTLSLGQSTSPVFRLALNPNGLPLPVQTKSRIFKAATGSNEPDFIMATHTLINVYVFT
jgi:nuclear receptor coactivator 2